MKIKNLNLPKYLLLSLIIIASSLNFYGCEEDSIINPTTTYGYMSVYHTLAGGPNVDIEINGTVVSSGVSYLQRLPYQQLTSGNNRLKIIAGSATVIDTTIFLSENKYYSVFVYQNGGNIIPLITTDNLTSPGNTNAAVRFIHLAPGTAALDIGADNKATPWFPFYTYGQVADFRPVVGDVYNLYMNQAGTSSTLANLIDQDLAAGRIYTVIAKGVPGGTGVQALGLALYQNQ